MKNFHANGIIMKSQCKSTVGKSSYDDMMDGDDDPPQVGRGQSPKGEKMGFDEYV